MSRLNRSVPSAAIASAAAVILVLASAGPSPAPAGFPKIDLDKFKKGADQGKKAIDAVRPMSHDEEKTLGDTVGRRLKSNYGVVEDAAIQRYVTLVGMTVARQVPPREGFEYRFIVL